MELTEAELAQIMLSQQSGSDDSDAKLTSIIQFLRKALPTSALAPDEKISIPKGNHYDGYTEDNTLHVDEFLYTDEEAEELTDAGLLARDYCASCGSKDIKPLSAYFVSPNYAFSPVHKRDKHDFHLIPCFRRSCTLLTTHLKTTFLTLCPEKSLDGFLPLPSPMWLVKRSLTSVRVLGPSSGWVTYSLTLNSS